MYEIKGRNMQEEIVVKQESEVQQENSELANTLLARAAELSKQNSSQIQERKQLEDEKVASVQSIEAKDIQPKYESFAEGFTHLKSVHDKKQEEAFETRVNNNPYRDKLEKTEVHENQQPSNTSENTPILSEEDEMLGDVTIGESVDKYKRVSTINNNQNPEQLNSNIPENIDNNINQTTDNTTKQPENVTGLDMF